MITSYDTLPIGRYKALLEIAERNDEEAAIDYIAVLSGKTREDIRNLPLARFLELKTEAAFLFDNPKEIQVHDRYSLGGHDYRVARSMADLTASQFIDYQQLVRDVDRDPVPLLSVLFVPKGYKYGDDYDIDEIKDDIREFLPVTDALALVSFFTALQARLSLPIRHSSARRRVRRQIGRMLRPSFSRGGAGWITSTRLLALPELLGTNAYNTALSNFSTYSRTTTTR